MQRAARMCLVIASLSMGLLMVPGAAFDPPRPGINGLDSCQPVDVPTEPVHSLRSTGPDILIGDLQSVLRFDRVGDITAYAVGTNVCNVGDQRVSWVASNRAHPVWGQGMYRLTDGRFEQIGMSWMVHGFYAVSQSFCAPCLDPTDGRWLGVGCSSPESRYLNGVQNNMSRRSDIDAYTGYFPYPPDSLPYDGTDPTAKRLQVHDADLDPALNPSAEYFVEALYIAADDAAAGNGDNNASYRRVSVTEQAPNRYEVRVSSGTGVTQRGQAAIRAWQDNDPSVYETDIQVPGEGLFILAAKATELGDGFWHYEYALQNLNSDRSAGSFSVPIARGAIIENIGFHDVDYHSGEVYDPTDWPGVVEDGAVVWSTEPYDVNPNANALRFDTLYNFWFDAKLQPRPSKITIGLFKPGAPDGIIAETIGPTAYTTGPDIIFGKLQSVLRFGRLGDITAFSVGTSPCNIGDQRVSYRAWTNAHPVCPQGMYRLRNGRFEQIGMSWASRGCLMPASQSLCTPCLDGTDGTELGVGCSDADSAYLHGVQNNMSPRSRVNAHTGYFPYPDPDWEGPDPEWPIGRRIQVHDADLDPDFNEGASYFIEALDITADDAAAGNGNNNASYRRVIVTEQSPNYYFVRVTSVTQREQPAIRAWQDADPSVRETDIQVPGEGLFILAAKATELGDGFWHYEYALQNLNSDRSAGSFSVPIPLGTPVENIGFHDVDYHSGEVYDLTDWPGVVEDGAVVWSTEPYDVNPNANALRFSTLYNFRFDTNLPPAPTMVTIDLFKPGVPSQVTADIVGPATEPRDCNQNGIWDGCDIECGGECQPPCGRSADCNGNYIPDECEPDCNRNGIADECDIRDAASGDCDENGVPDECEPDCDGDGIPDDCDTFEDTDGDGIDDCYDLCPDTTPAGACVCPSHGRCCCPTGFCFDGYPRSACIEIGCTPDCFESLCRDGCLIGDLDGDGDRDLRDYAALQRCYGGSDEDASFDPPSTECTLHFDFDEDGDVDWDDFRVFQVEHDGPSPVRLISSRRTSGISAATGRDIAAHPAIEHSRE